MTRLEQIRARWDAADPENYDRMDDPDLEHAQIDFQGHAFVDVAYLLDLLEAMEESV